MVIRVDTDDTYRLIVTAYIIAWPLYTAVYVGWGVLTYTCLDRNPSLLTSLSASDDEVA